MIETYSASSLRLLQKDRKEYEQKYKNSLFFGYKTENEKKGSMFHKLLYYHLNGFNVSKMIENLSNEERDIWQKFIASDILKKEYLGVEQSFLVKVKCDVPFCLNGRFDAILKEEDCYTIYDWKSENIPRDPENDIQTIVYMHCASKLFNTKNIKVKYVSINKLDTCEVIYNDNKNYEKNIIDIVSH